MDTVHAIAGVRELNGAIQGDSYVLGAPIPGDAPDSAPRLFQATHSRLPGAYTVALFSDPAGTSAESDPWRATRDGERQLEGALRAGALLRHPGIAQTFDFSERGASSVFVVLGPLAGRSLKETLRQDGMMPLPVVVNIIGQVVDALEAAHALNIVHGHLHPGMIRVAETSPGKPEVVVLGFGWGRLLAATAHAQAGQPAPPADEAAPYRAPEQKALNPRRDDAGLGFDQTSDQFAVATIAYEMLAGCLPFSDETADLVDDASARQAHPSSFADVVVGLPLQLDEPFRRALSFAPADRFRRLRDFVEALRATTGLSEMVHGSDAPELSISPASVDAPPPRQFAASVIMRDMRTPPRWPRQVTPPLPTRAHAAPNMDDQPTPPSAFVEPPAPGKSPAVVNAGFWAEAGLSWGTPPSDAPPLMGSAVRAPASNFAKTSILGLGEAIDSGQSSGGAAPFVSVAGATTGSLMHVYQAAGEGGAARAAVPLRMVTPPTWPIDGEQQQPVLPPPSPLTLRSSTKLPPYIHVLFAAAVVALVVGAVSEMSHRRTAPSQSAAPTIKPVTAPTIDSTAPSSAATAASNAVSAPSLERPSARATPGAPAGGAKPSRATPIIARTEAVLVPRDVRRDQPSIQSDARQSDARHSAQRRRKARRSSTTRKAPAPTVSVSTFTR